MTALDITRIKAAAQAAQVAAPGDWMSTGVVIATPTDGGMEYLLQTMVGDDHPVLAFVEAAQPAAVLELIERLERMQEMARALHQVGNALGLPAGADVTRDVLMTVHHMEANELALRDRMERAESLAETLDEQVQCLTNQRNEFKAIAQDAEEVINSKLPPITQCPGCYMVHDPRHREASAMPNDPLDDVLPLAEGPTLTERAGQLIYDAAKKGFHLKIDGRKVEFTSTIPLPEGRGGHHD